MERELLSVLVFHTRPEYLNKIEQTNDSNFIDINANAAKSITDLWQQYSPTTWSEMYNEYVKYTIRITEIYQEYAKSSEKMTELYKELAINAEKMTELYKESAKNTEKMTKYWLNYFSWMKLFQKIRRRNKNKKVYDYTSKYVVRNYI
jgi:hypothetical protein